MSSGSFYWKLKTRLVVLETENKRAYISNSLYWKLVVLETENKAVTRLWSRMEPNAPRYGGASQPPKYIHGIILRTRSSPASWDESLFRKKHYMCGRPQHELTGRPTKLTGMLVSGRRDKERRNGLTRRREVVTALAVVGENLVVRISEVRRKWVKEI
ncbi:hypothetical protein K438DRAFT_1754741 [Mycena galopus ATCC 62051]|nr:hypothetical protein K438DRAFT_1754741 [Mycena galopus ATCC 62051]